MIRSNRALERIVTRDIVTEQTTLTEMAIKGAVRLLHRPSNSSSASATASTQHFNHPPNKQIQLQLF
jgi:hypothetical protein